MKEGRFQWDILIARPPHEALSLLSDFSRYTLLHPLIIAVEEATPTPGVMKSCLISDQLQMGPMRFKIRYRANILHINDREVFSEALHPPGIAIQNRTRVEPEQSGLRLDETVFVQAPNLLFGYVFSAVKKTRGEMLGRIKLILEAEGK